MRDTRSLLKKVGAAAIFASFLVVAAASTPAFADTIIVGSGTSGGVPNTGVLDPNLRVVAGPADSDFSDAAFAVAVTTLNGGGGTNPFIVFNTSWAVILGTLYVSPVSAGGTSEGPTGAYRATFDLPSFSSASLGLDFLSDNSLNGFLLNGNAISTPGGGFGSVTHVDVTDSSFFTVGTNSLILRGVDGGGPGGLDFKATVTFTPAVDGGGAVPEPATVALLGIGLVGLGFARRKRACAISALPGA